MLALGDVAMSPRVIHVVTAGVGLVLAGVLTLVLVRVEDPTAGHWPALDLTLRTVALMCGAPLLAGGVLCCVWARPLSCYVDDDIPRS
ncbi:hypothetical protein EP51_05930 [Rhodococcus opacus]|uniref:Uncharacterized protein n=2 Tax=Nocardiaceae TaxID=85025 RepID=A0A076EET9_RHOOP|nr:hypothetical protein EP51_05930 [Rhodococcus opacus]